MNDHLRTLCPKCGARNGPGAPFCAACGKTLLRAGYAARPAEDDEDDEERRPVKKVPSDAVQKGAPKKGPSDAVQKGAPKKPASKPVDDEDEEDEPRRPVKKASRPVDEDDDDEPRPAKKKARREEEEEEEEASIRDNPLLNMLFPVGTSIWAMGALYLGIFSILGVGLGYILAATMESKVIGLVLPLGGAALGFPALLLGVLSFFLRPKKTTYGALTGYIRAVVGIFCGIAGLIGGPVVSFWLIPSQLGTLVR
jgi:hypothetical protein